jgi:hypothetical protein
MVHYPIDAVSISFTIETWAGITILLFVRVLPLRMVTDGSLSFVGQPGRNGL